MNLALETYNNDGKLLTNPNTQLKNEGFYRRHTVCWIVSYIIMFPSFLSTDCATIGVCLL